MPNTSMVFARNTVRSLELSEAEKEAAEKSLKMDSELVASNTALQIAQNQAAIDQVEEASQQTSPQAAQAAPAQGGAPVELPPELLGGAQAEPAIANPPQTGAIPIGAQ